MSYETAIQATIAAIRPADRAAMAQARARQDSLAKPPRSLGVLEELSIRLAGMTGQVHNTVERRRIVVFCADNGVCEEGVSSAPQSVTLAQTVNLTRGITGASALAKHFGEELTVVDVGVDGDLACPAVVDRKVARGTKNMLREPAMTRLQALQAMTAGVEQACIAKSQGIQLLGLGEMGIGNTTTSSAVLAALLNRPPEQVTGRGGGLLDEAFLHKKQVIRRALELHAPDAGDPIDVLAKVGGFDLCAMCGAFLGAAAERLPVVIDGFIAAVAAVCAARLCPAAADYMIPSHASFEPGFRLAMEALGLRPYLQLEMRLGEGSGCPLAFLTVEAACAVMNEMGTFQQAAIDDGYLTDIRKGDAFSVSQEESSC